MNEFTKMIDAYKNLGQAIGYMLVEIEGIMKKAGMLEETRRAILSSLVAATIQTLLLSIFAQKTVNTEEKNSLDSLLNSILKNLPTGKGS